MPTLWQGVSDTVFKARDAAQGFINALRAEVYGKSFLGQASSYGGMLVNFIKGLIIGVGQDIKGQLELIWNLVTDGWNTVKDLINGIISIIKNPALLLNIFTQVFDNMQGKDIYGQIQEIGKWIGETFADAIYGPLAALTVNTGLASNISKVLGMVSDQVKTSDKIMDFISVGNKIIKESMTTTWVVNNITDVTNYIATHAYTKHILQNNELKELSTIAEFQKLANEVISEPDIVKYLRDNRIAYGKGNVVIIVNGNDLGQSTLFRTKSSQSAIDKINKYD